MEQSFNHRKDWDPEGSHPQTVMVVSDATKDLTDLCALKWSIANLARQGDHIIVLGIVHHARQRCSPKLKIAKTLGALPRALLGSHSAGDCFSDASNCQKESEQTELQNLVVKKREMYRSMFEKVRTRCRKNGIRLEVNIMAGYPRKQVGVREARISGAKWVVLDRHLKKDRRYFMENLACGLVVMKRNNEGDIIKIVSFLRGPVHSEGGEEEDDDNTVETGGQKPVRRSARLFEDSSSSDFAMGTDSSLSSPSSSDSSLHGPVVPKDFSKKQEIIPQNIAAHFDAADLQARLQEEKLRAHPDKNQDAEAGITHYKADILTLNSPATESGIESGPDSCERWQRRRSHRLFPGISSPPALCSTCRHITPTFGPPTRIPLRVLAEATDNFDEKHFMTDCGDHKVYKGILEGKGVVSIKRMDVNSEDYTDAEFKNEIDILRIVHHKNVVTLVGYCIEKRERILVYEFTCNKTLAWHLSPLNPTVLPWATRWKIAQEVARGLCYLHGECRSGSIVHAALTPEHILLTHDFMPLICHFANAKVQEHSDITSNNRNRLPRTPDKYLAPECTEVPTITAKADVFSFGMLMRELVTGGQSMGPTGQKSNAMGLDIESYSEMADPLLKDQYDLSELHSMVFTSSLCIRPEVSMRPSMRKVLSFLDEYDSGTESSVEFEGR